MSYYTSYSDKNSNPKPITALVHVPTPPTKEKTEKPNDPPTAPVTPLATEPEPTPRPSPYKKLLGKTTPYLINPWAITVAAVILAASFSGFLFIKYSGSPSKPNQPATLGAQDSTKKILEDIAKIMVIPADQTPTIATVTNVEKLRLTQPFFNAAKNGDKLLIFTDKAILYRPDENKIVDIGPVNRPSEASPEADTKPTVSTTPTPTTITKPQPTPEATTSAH